MSKSQIADGLWQVWRHTRELIVSKEEAVQVPEFAEHILAYLVRLELVVEQHNPDQVGSIIKHPILDAVDLVALQVGVLDV